MTIGNGDRDHRKYIVDPNGIPHLCGVYYGRQWSGSDDPINKKAQNPYTSVTWRSYNPYITWKRNLPGAGPQYGNFTEVHGPWVIYEDSDVFTDQNKHIAIINKLGNKVRNTDFQPWVTTAQAGQTAGQILNTASSLANAILRVKKGDIRGAAKALSVNPNSHKNSKAPTSADEISGRWLELQYGWLPLLGDLHSGALALATLIAKPAVKTVRVRERAEKTKEFNLMYTKHKAVTIESRDLHVRYVENIPPFDFTLLDPLLIAWELIPYSFVADWFLPVGDFLEAQKVIRQLKVESVVTSRRVRKSTMCVGFTNNPINSGYIHLSGDMPAVFAHYMVRTVSTSLPSVGLPRAVNPADALGLRRGLNAVALLKNAFK